MTDLSMPRTEHLLCFALYSASHAFTRFYQPMLERLGLTYPQFLVLVALSGASGGSLSVGQLTAELHLETNTLSPLLKRMEGAGLLIRARDPDDERRVLVRLTEVGAGVAQQAGDFPACIADCLPEQASADAPDMIAALNRLRGWLGQVDPAQVNLMDETGL